MIRSSGKDEEMTLIGFPRSKREQRGIGAARILVSGSSGKCEVSSRRKPCFLVMHHHETLRFPLYVSDAEDRRPELCLRVDRDICGCLCRTEPRDEKSPYVFFAQTSFFTQTKYGIL